MRLFHRTCRLILRLWRWLMGEPFEPVLDCRDVMHRLWEFLDGEVAADEQRSLGRHIAECGHCNPEYRVQLRFLQAVIESQHLPVSAPPDLAARIRVRLGAAT